MDGNETRSSSIKCSLTSILKNNRMNALEVIDDAVERYSAIRKHSLLALQWVLISLDQEQIGLICRPLINAVISTIARRNMHRHTEQKYAEVIRFIRSRYMSIFFDKIPSSEGLTSMLGNLSASILVLYTTNMRHFLKDVKRFARMKMDDRGIPRSTKIVLDHVLHTEGVANLMGFNLMPGRLNRLPVTMYNEEENGEMEHPHATLSNILKYNPLHLFWKRMELVRMLMLRNRKHCNIFPKAKSFQRSSMPITSRDLVHLFAGKLVWRDFEGCTNKSQLLNQLNDPDAAVHDQLWGCFFKLNWKWFKTRLRNVQGGRNIVFNHYIMTNGIDTSVNFREGDRASRPIRRRINGVETEDPNLRYVQDLSEEELAALENRPLVGVDPNKRDVLYCIAPDPDPPDHPNPAKRYKTFRYTSMQRRLESGAKYYAQVMKKNKKLNPWVAEYEQEMAMFNSKTVFPGEFHAYLLLLEGIMGEMTSFYDNISFRIMRWNAKKNRRSSEDKMVQKLYNKFSIDGVKPVLGLGDWGETKQRRYMPPSITKGMRKVLIRNKVDFFLVDEYHTSKTCSSCLTGENKTFFYHGHKPLKDQNGNMNFRRNGKVDKKRSLCTGLLRCDTCSIIWNRDFNSARNMYAILQSYINGNGRPEYLARPVENPAE